MLAKRHFPEFKMKGFVYITSAWTHNKLRWESRGAVH